MSDFDRNETKARAHNASVKRALCALVGEIEGAGGEAADIMVAIESLAAGAIVYVARKHGWTTQAALVGLVASLPTRIDEVMTLSSAGNDR